MNPIYESISNCILLHYFPGAREVHVLESDEDNDDSEKSVRSHVSETGDESSVVSEDTAPEVIDLLMSDSEAEEESTTVFASRGGGKLARYNYNSSTRQISISPLGNDVT